MALTPEDLAAAANTIEEFSRRLEYACPAKASWSPHQLRAEVEHLRAELDDERIRAALTDEILSSLNAADGLDRRTAILNVLAGWDVSRELYAPVK